MYKVESNQGGKRDLVISGFEKGIASSPYLGISNMIGFNSAYYPGVAYVNYKRQAATINDSGWYAGTHSTNVSGNAGWMFTAPGSGGAIGTPVAKAVSPSGVIYLLDSSGSVFKQSAAYSSTFSYLSGGAGRVGLGNKGLAYWNNYLFVFGAGLIEICGDGTGDAGITSSNWNVEYAYSQVVHTVSGSFNTRVVMTSPTLLGVLGINSPVTFTTTGTLPAPLVVGTTYYIKSEVAVGQFTISATIGGAAVIFTDDGTGTHTMTLVANVLPMGNCTNFNWGGSVGSATLTINSYVNPSGVTVGAGVWLEASGTYNIIDVYGNETPGTFTYGSASVSLLAPLVVSTSSNSQIQLLNSAATTYKTHVSKADGNLYYGNGRYVGRILAQNTNVIFSPGFTSTYTVNYAATAILQNTDTVVDLTDLQSTMVIAGQRDTYNWNYLTPNTTAPSPVPELITGIINNLNNIYILAGQKGNIYISNGYSSQVFYKIPDYISGIIDPVWSYGDLMVHRGKIFFQALASSTAGTDLMAGIFSLNVSPAFTPDVSMSNVFVMENQNSYGLVPAASSTGAGLLINSDPSSSGADSYYSAWSNGASLGGIDYNNTTLWANYEPTIETELIPIGDFLNKKTLGLIEFKLDRPLATDDAIRMYARTSLSDSYTLLGTTTTAQLSDYYQTNVFEQQWVQFKVQVKCAASLSSFVPLREIRLHLP